MREWEVRIQAFVFFPATEYGYASVFCNHGPYGARDIRGIAGLKV